MTTLTTELFIPIKFNTSIQLIPKELNITFEETILKKLKNNLENMCSKHGYIKANSIKIIKRSAGFINKSHFNGNINYNLQCIAEICNPAQGSIISCRVINKNSLGLFAEGYYDNKPILEIIIPKISAGIKSEINIDEIKIGDEIKIEVCGKKFMLYDKHISIIGKAIKDKEINIKTNIADEINIDLEETENDIIDDDNIIIDPLIDDEYEEVDSDDEISIDGKKSNKNKKKMDDDDDEEDEEEDELEIDDEDMIEEEEMEELEELYEE